jgi:hypothetical protein
LLAGLCLILSQGDGHFERANAPAAAPVAAAAPNVSHRFWTAKNWFATSLGGGAHSPYTMYPEPLALATTPHGLLVGYAPAVDSAEETADPEPPPPAAPDFILGAEHLTTSKVEESSPGDRMVDLDFGGMRTRVGRGMPFVYVTTRGNDPTITFNADPQPFDTHQPDKPNLLGVQVAHHFYGLFCPALGNWTRSQIDASNGSEPVTHTVYTCHLPPGHNYFSVALLPDRESFHQFADLAFTFPTATHLDWSYDQEHSRVFTTFTVDTEQKEGWVPPGSFLQAIYPHQYGALYGPAQPQPAGSYASSRGPMHLFSGFYFTTENSFHGILPFLPVPEHFDAETERKLLEQVAGEPTLTPVPDSYTQGKALVRLSQLLPLAQASGQPALLQQFKTALRNQFALWSSPVKASDPRTRPRFVYNAAWGTLVGFPAGTTDGAELNDHYHYGNWIQAAAMLGFYDRAWIAKDDNRRFIGQLARDIANIDRTDSMYPMLRHFDAFAGHSWISGQTPFGDRDTQESSSEAANAWAGLMLFATETGDTRLRDAAIWMYTLETNAAMETWSAPEMARHGSGAAPAHALGVSYSAADRVRAGSNRSLKRLDFLPFTGASLYLSRDPGEVRRNLVGWMHAAAAAAPQSAPSASADALEMYEAFYDPNAALSQWQHTRGTFDGESRAHEFAWLSSLAALGRVDRSVLADTPFFAVFRDESGERKHIVFNPGDTAATVHFTDGHVEQVPARSMVSEGRLLGL